MYVRVRVYARISIDIIHNTCIHYYPKNLRPQWRDMSDVLLLLTFCLWLEHNKRVGEFCIVLPIVCVIVQFCLRKMRPDNQLNAFISLCNIFWACNAAENGWMNERKRRKRMELGKCALFVSPYSVRCVNNTNTTYRPGNNSRLKVRQCVYCTRSTQP